MEAAFSALIDAARAFNREGAVQPERAALRRAITAIEPELRQFLEAWAHTHARLLRRTEIGVPDVLQHVVSKMLVCPPRNRDERDPRAVVLAWSKRVAMNYAIDSIQTDIAPPPPSSNTGAGEVSDANPGPESKLRGKETAARFDQVAKRVLPKHKYQYELYLLLRDDPEITAQELAVALGLLNAIADGSAPEATGEEARKAVVNVWQIRSRVLKALREASS